MQQQISSGFWRGPDKKNSVISGSILVRRQLEPPANPKPVFPQKPKRPDQHVKGRKRSREMRALAVALGRAHGEPHHVPYPLAQAITRSQTE